MALPFKIPKKKSGSDSTPLFMQSPLSRLQSSAPHPQVGYGNSSNRGGADRMHAGNAAGSSRDRQRTPCKPLFRDVVKTLLGLNSTNDGSASAANPRAVGSWSRQSQVEQRGGSPNCLPNRWRPKRASDRLLQPEAASEPPSPPQKKKPPPPPAAVSKSVSVDAVDALAELRGDEHAGSLRRTLETHRNTPETKIKSSAGSSSGSPLKPQKNNSSLSTLNQTLPSGVRRPSSSSAVLSSKTAPDGRRSLDRRVCPTADNDLNVDEREKERERWKQFRDKNKKNNRSAVLHLRLRRSKPTPSEPIVLSSEEEEGEDNGDEAKSSDREDEPCRGDSETLQAQRRSPVTPPSELQIEFTSLHVGLTTADANGTIMITENGITIPVKGEEECEVTVVASQIRGYGVWDGGVAQGGTLLAGWEGPAPSLLFLWVTDAQASLLQRELSDLQTCFSSCSGPRCSFVLLLLKEQLQGLQAALLASIFDIEEYKYSSSSKDPASPLDWTAGLLLLHSCPPPVDQHLLRLLGHSKKSDQLRSSQRNKKSLNSALQQLPTRLIQYPMAPCKGRISVTKEDLACLDAGEFLNDVIIDFYLKYLLMEGVAGSVAERSHVFSSFFYKQLSRRRAAGESDAPSVPDRHTRHQRVKTWTRHVDIFSKDFLFVPVNQEAHWFLVVVCFPGLDDVRYGEFQSRAGGSDRKPHWTVKTQQTPECTEQGWQKDKVLQRPCVLVMDSLKLSYHDNVCRLIRDYLQVEWEVRRKTPRLFTSNSLKSFNCRVPQQDNSSDCGVYLLQYVESFLQNPVVHFDLPPRLENWFPRQEVRRKREAIRSLIVKLHRSQAKEDEPKPAPSH